MTERTLLWVDLCLQDSKKNRTRYFDEFFKIRVDTPAGLDVATGRNRPVALVLDYDFPDSAGLRFLEETKAAHPSIPILMLTVQHSEELAVWAFRARVWDYFVKPLDRCDVVRCYESLCRIEPGSVSRRSVRSSPPVPEHVRLSRASADNKRRLAPAVAYVQSHYSEKLAQKDLATLCGLSTFRFSRLFHATFGQTFQDYLLRYRLERAQVMLLNPVAGVSDVAYAAGFRDASYFGRAFRKLFAMSPTQWRQQQWRDHQPAQAPAVTD